MRSDVHREIERNTERDRVRYWRGYKDIAGDRERYSRRWILKKSIYIYMYIYRSGWKYIQRYITGERERYRWRYRKI